MAETPDKSEKPEKSFRHTAETTSLFAEVETLFAEPATSREASDFGNMIDFPLGILSEKSDTDDHIEVTDEGKTVTFYGPNGQTFRILGSARYGLPTLWEESLLIALLEMGREQGVFLRGKSGEFPGRIFFTRYGLAQKLGVTRTGKAYHQIERGIRRLLATTYEADKCFYNKKSKTYGSAVFHVLASGVFDNEKPGLKGEDHELLSFVDLSTEMMGDVERGYLIPLDTKTYFALETPLARRLFRILNKRTLDRKPKLEMSLLPLAHERLGISRRIMKPSRVKVYLDKPLEELRNLGVISDATYEPMSTADGEKIVFRFVPIAEAQASSPQVESGTAATPPTPSVSAPAAPDLIGRLRAAGLSRADAVRLATDFAEESERQLLYLPYNEQDYKKRGEHIEKPSSFLKSAIEKGYATPDSYQREQKAAVKGAAGTTAAASQTAKKPVEPSPAEVTLARHRTQVSEYLAGLSEADSEALDAEAASRTRVKSPAIIRGFRIAIARERLGLPPVS